MQHMRTEFEIQSLLQSKFIMSTQRLTHLRLQKQQQSLKNDPIKGVIVTRENLLNFHFCLHELTGDYQGGFYHGVLELHQNYPFAAPKLKFFTPNGRFEVNIPICTSFTNYHQQTWTSAWNVRTLILATISFMYSEQASYGCKNDTPSIRQTLAKNSLDFNQKNPVFMKLFGNELKELGILSNEQLQPQDIKIPEEEGLIQRNSERRRNFQKLLIAGGCILAGVVTVLIIINV